MLNKLDYMSGCGLVVLPVFYVVRYKQLAMVDGDRITLVLRLALALGGRS